MAETTRLKLRWAGGQFSDPRKQVRSDAERVLQDITGRGAPDFIGISEAETNGHVAPIYADVALERGWHVYDPPKSGCMIFARHPLLDAGYRHVIDANTGMPKGNYGHRGIAYAAAHVENVGEVWYHAKHALTDFQLGDNPGDNLKREGSNTRLWTAAGQETADHGKGPALAFLAGDFNVHAKKDTGKDPHGPEAILGAHGLVSCWDALGKYPATHRGGKPIDWVMHRRGDGRVKLRDAVIRNVKGRYSDHHIVDAYYDVRAPKVTVEPVPAVCPTCGQLLPAVA